MSPSDGHSVDVTAADFERLVVERSRRDPVLVDFWADWCAPCRALKPVLEKLALEFGGRFVLAKVDTVTESALSTQHGVRSLPTVRLYLDGKPIDEFLGAKPESEIRRFLERHLPRVSDRIVENAVRQHATDPTAAKNELRQTVKTDPGSDRAKLALAHLLITTETPREEDITEAKRLWHALTPDGRTGASAKGLRSRIEMMECLSGAPPRAELEERVAADPNGLEFGFLLALNQILAGEYDPGMARLIEIVKVDRKFRDDAARRMLLATFDMLGPTHEHVQTYRALLSRALY